ncbi:hypothetical protein [Marinimicrobium sp. ABcell2]|uniref:hypothetical protein n=1 Tax=Marinimicrobium sp. ABcell2 TaxID=3069751 RepID=UPI0027B647C3|nr:hypothetical protein [Marinimicrobium sp. ABcell2]MDQ2077830.1 hypothetical protein [Marinimicrobium sp. ABcell2]
MSDSKSQVNADSLHDELTLLVKLHRELVADYEAGARRLERAAYQKVFGDFVSAHNRSIETLGEILKRFDGDVETATASSAEAQSNDAAVLRAIQSKEIHLKQEYVRNLGLLSGTAGLETVLKVNKGEATKRLGWLEGELNMLDHTKG